MTQTSTQIKLEKAADAMNRKAARLGRHGHISAMELGVLAMKQWYCSYCGVSLAPWDGTFDHAIPFDRGGRNVASNLVRSCQRCNRAKQTKTPAEFERYLKRLNKRYYCKHCGVEFKPRIRDMEHGYGQFCSRAHATTWRWQQRAAASP